MAFIENIGRKKQTNLSIDDKTSTLDINGLRENIPSEIVLHGTYNYPFFRMLLQAHREKEFAGVGYHFFISEDNLIHQARPLFLEGAHALGYNTHSIGIAMYLPKSGSLGKRVSVTQNLINELKLNYGPLNLISHTQAQAEYINRIVKEAGYNHQFPTGSDITDERNFQVLKNDVEGFLGQLSTEGNQKIKNKLKALKNCPGPIFKEFI